ncbi:MAG: antibiotic biosynthesis monooxygenase, partial [Gammaproteobacteria bacterium]
MFIAMNRFKVIPGNEEKFINVWKNRDTYIETLPGFKSFNLLQGPSTEEYTLISSHTTWETKENFEAWIDSEEFKKAHVRA